MIKGKFKIVYFISSNYCIIFYYSSNIPYKRKFNESFPGGNDGSQPTSKFNNFSGYHDLQRQNSGFSRGSYGQGRGYRRNSSFDAYDAEFNQRGGGRTGRGIRHTLYFYNQFFFFFELLVIFFCLNVGIKILKRKSI